MSLSDSACSACFAGQDFWWTTDWGSSHIFLGRQAVLCIFHQHARRFFLRLLGGVWFCLLFSPSSLPRVSQPRKYGGYLVKFLYRGVLLSCLSISWEFAWNLFKRGTSPARAKAWTANLISLSSLFICPLMYRPSYHRDRRLAGRTCLIFYECGGECQLSGQLSSCYGMEFTLLGHSDAFPMAWLPTYSCAPLPAV